MGKKQKILIFIALLVIVIFACVFSNALLKILSLLVFAAIEAYLLYPFIKILEKRMPRNWAIILGFLLLIVISVGAVMLLIPVFVSQIKNLLNYLPLYITEMKEFASKIPYISRFFESLKINESIFKKTTDLLSFFSPSKLVSFFSSTFLVPVIVFYMLKERERLKEISLFMLPGKMRTPAIYIFRDINRQLRDYVIGEIIIIITVSFLMAAVLGIFGFQYWLILGVVMGIFNIIPYIGPILGSIPIIFTAFLQNKVILALILILLVQQIDNLIIHPRIISDSVKIHPVIVLLCVVAGNTVGNLLGMVLAIPLFIIFRILFKEFYKYFSERKGNFPHFSKI